MLIAEALRNYEEYVDTLYQMGPSIPVTFKSDRLVIEWQNLFSRNYHK